MAKSKAKKDPGKKAGSKARDDGNAEIRRAEKRLAKALTGVDEAREKVRRRERDLAELMERYGRTAPVIAVADDAIPLEAPSHPVAVNGVADLDAEPAGAEPVEQTASTDGAEHHE